MLEDGIFARKYFGELSMTPEQFCYWLQGIAECGNTFVQPTPRQWSIIKDHLQLVFKKETPSYLPTEKELIKKMEESVLQMRDGIYSPPICSPVLTC
jgi:hypothetical protein